MDKPEGNDVKETSVPSTDNIGTEGTPSHDISQGGGDTATDDVKEQAIPYERFREVNEKYKTSEARRQELESYYEQVNTNLDGVVEERMGKLLQDATFQKQYYDQLAKTYGSTQAKAIVADNVQQAKAGQPLTLPPEIQAQLNDLTAWKAQQEGDAKLMAAMERTTAEMKKHPIFTTGVFAADGEFGDIAEKVIVAELNSNRAMPMPMVIANAAKKLATMGEKMRTSYVENKTNAGKAVPSVVKGSKGAPGGIAKAPANFEEATAAFQKKLEEGSDE